MPVEINDDDKSGLLKAAMVCDEHASEICAIIKAGGIPENVIAGLNEAVFQVRHISKILRSYARNDTVDKVLEDCRNGKVYHRYELIGLAEGNINVMLMGIIQELGVRGFLEFQTDGITGDIKAVTTKAGLDYLKQ